MGASGNRDQAVLGEFKFDRSTKNTHRYQRVTDTGRTETIYIPKDALPANPPEVIESIVRW